MWSRRVKLTSSTNAASGRALAAAHGTGHQHQAVMILCEQLELRRQAKLGHGLHLAIDDAKSEIVAKSLPHDTGSEATKRVRVGEVHIAAVSHRFATGHPSENSRPSRSVSAAVKTGAWTQIGSRAPNLLQGGTRAYGEMDVGRPRLFAIIRY